MDLKSTRKRSRESDLTDCTDCLPLSKRINSLSIDNSFLPVAPEGLFQINVNVEQNQSCNVIAQEWQSPPVHSPESLPSTSYTNENHSTHLYQSNSHNINAHNQQTSAHHIHNSFSQAQPPLPTFNQTNEEQWNNSNNTQASWVSSLKYSHDNIDSEYYVNNRLLFNLYLERISRTGQPPANPY